MAIIQGMTTSYRQQLLEAVHDFRALGGDTFKMALYTSLANLGPSTTTYSSTNEVVASGYTAGGITLVNLGTASSGLIGYASFSDVSWTSTFTTGGALIYNTTPTHTYTNPSVMVLSFGIDRSSTNNLFSITFPANQPNSAIIRIGQLGN